MKVLPLMESVEDYVKKVILGNHLSKRGQIVVHKILENGSVTTPELEELGYNHPPRAIRDVREAGIPLITTTISDGSRRFGKYTFGKSEDIKEHMLGGRVTFPKSFKKKLLEIQGNRCAICDQQFDDKYLQIDHRVPYEYNGDSKKLDIQDYMLLCAECNKKKDRATKTGCSKTCFKTHDLSIIRSCFWASPENYTHICMQPIRRLDITWLGKQDTIFYDNLRKKAVSQNISLQELVKNILSKYI